MKFTIRMQPSTNQFKKTFFYCKSEMIVLILVLRRKKSISRRNLNVAREKSHVLLSFRVAQTKKNSRNRK